MGMKMQGSATVEASITLPIFLMAVLTVVSLMQYPGTYRQVGSAMSDVARMLSAGGYFAHLSGLQAVGNEVGRIASNGFVIGSDKLNEVTDTLSALAIEPSSEATPVKEAISQDNSIKMTPGGMAEGYKALSRVLTSGAGQWVGAASNEVLNGLVLTLSTARLVQANGTSKGGTDPWRRLGIQNGMDGVDFSNSRYFTEDGTIELVAVYAVKPPSLLGLAPAVRLCSRVRVVAWGAGVGPSLRQALSNDEEGNPDDTSVTSLWNLGNDASHLWQRGKAIEEAALDKLEGSLMGGGTILLRAPARQSGYDALSVGLDITRATGFQFVSMNPFLATYRDNPSAVKGLIREQASHMPRMGDKVSAGNGRPPVCISAGCLTIVVPENAPAWLDAAILEEKAEMARTGIALNMIRGYGTYDGPE